MEKQQPRFGKLVKLLQKVENEENKTQYGIWG